MIATGVMFGYAIQLFVAIQIMFSGIPESFKLAEKYPIIAELMFRTLMVIVTFTVAAVVPNLSLLLSLIGCVGCVVLAFVLPVLSELIILHNEVNGIGWLYWIKNVTILLIALVGFIFGGYISLKSILNEIIKKFSE